jgi:hypothetical protein
LSIIGETPPRSATPAATAAAASDKKSFVVQVVEQSAK